MQRRARPPSLWMVLQVGTRLRAFKSPCSYHPICANPQYSAPRMPRSGGYCTTPVALCVSFPSPTASSKQQQSPPKEEEEEKEPLPGPSEVYATSVFGAGGAGEQDSEKAAPLVVGEKERDQTMICLPGYEGNFLMIFSAAALDLLCCGGHIIIQKSKVRTSTRRHLHHTLALLFLYKPDSVAGQLLFHGRAVLSMSGLWSRGQISSVCLVVDGSCQHLHMYIRIHIQLLYRLGRATRTLVCNSSCPHVTAVHSAKVRGILRVRVGSPRG